MEAARDVIKEMQAARIEIRGVQSMLAYLGRHFHTEDYESIQCRLNNQGASAAWDQLYDVLKASGFTVFCDFVSKIFSDEFKCPLKYKEKLRTECRSKGLEYLCNVYSTNSISDVESVATNKDWPVQDEGPRGKLHVSSNSFSSFESVGSRPWSSIDSNTEVFSERPDILNRQPFEAKEKRRYFRLSSKGSDEPDRKSGSTQSFGSKGSVDEPFIISVDNDIRSLRTKTRDRLCNALDRKSVVGKNWRDIAELLAEVFSTIDHNTVQKLEENDKGKMSELLEFMQHETLKVQDLVDICLKIGRKDCIQILKEDGIQGLPDVICKFGTQLSRPESESENHLKKQENGSEQRSFAREESQSPLHNVEGWQKKDMPYAWPQQESARKHDFYDRAEQYQMEAETSQRRHNDELSHKCKPQQETEKDTKVSEVFPTNQDARKRQLAQEKYDGIFKKESSYRDGHSIDSKPVTETKGKVVDECTPKKDASQELQLRNDTKKGSFNSDSTKKKLDLLVLKPIQEGESKFVSEGKFLSGELTELTGKEKTSKIKLNEELIGIGKASKVNPNEELEGIKKVSESTFKEDPSSEKETKRNHPIQESKGKAGSIDLYHEKQGDSPQPSQEINGKDSERAGTIQEPRAMLKGGDFGKKENTKAPTVAKETDEKFFGDEIEEHESETSLKGLPGSEKFKKEKESLKAVSKSPDASPDKILSNEKPPTCLAYVLPLHSVTPSKANSSGTSSVDSTSSVSPAADDNPCAKGSSATFEGVNRGTSPKSQTKKAERNWKESATFKNEFEDDSGLFLEEHPGYSLTLSHPSEESQGFSYPTHEKSRDAESEYNESRCLSEELEDGETESRLRSGEASQSCNRSTNKSNQQAIERREKLSEKDTRKKENFRNGSFTSIESCTTGQKKDFSISALFQTIVETTFDHLGLGRKPLIQSQKSNKRVGFDSLSAEKGSFSRQLSLNPVPSENCESEEREGRLNETTPSIPNNDYHGNVDAVAAGSDKLSFYKQISSKGRYALIIDNHDYEFITKLPVNNCSKKLMTCLQECGWDVERRENLSRQCLHSAIEQFAAKSKEAFSFFYYFGHSLQFHGENYILPQEIENQNVKTKANLRKYGLSVESIRSKLSNSMAGLLFLDAGRKLPGLYEKSGFAAIKPRQNQCMICATSDPNRFAADLLTKRLKDSDVIDSVKDLIEPFRNEVESYALSRRLLPMPLKVPSDKKDLCDGFINMEQTKLPKHGFIFNEACGVLKCITEMKGWMVTRCENNDNLESDFEAFLKTVEDDSFKVCLFFYEGVISMDDGKIFLGSSTLQTNLEAVSLSWILDSMAETVVGPRIVVIRGTGGDVVLAKFDEHQLNLQEVLLMVSSSNNESNDSSEFCHDLVKGLEDCVDVESLIKEIGSKYGCRTIGNVLFHLRF